MQLSFLSSLVRKYLESSVNQDWWWFG